MLTPLQRLNCYFKALADGKSDSLHNTLSTAVKVNVSGLAQASNVLQPRSCKFFPCVFFLFPPCASCCSASLDVFIVAHGWAETDTPLLLSLLTYLDYACLCVLFWGTACPFCRCICWTAGCCGSLCLNVFVLLCWGRQGLQARVLQKYYGLIFFFEMGEVSLKSQHIAMSERVFIRMTSGAVSRARLRSSFFYPPSPPLQGCSWVMTSLLHLAGTLRIMSWLGMSHHSGNPVCVEAIAHHKSHQLTVFS